METQQLDFKVPLGFYCPFLKMSNFFKMFNNNIMYIIYIHIYCSKHVVHHYNSSWKDAKQVFFSLQHKNNLHAAHLLCGRDSTPFPWHT